MSDDHQTRRDIETLIRTKLVELIRLSTEHGVGIERLMREALDECDPEVT